VIAARPALGRRGVVAGVGRDAAYVDAGGFVVVLTLGRPVLPNGAQVARLPAAGDEVVVHAGEVWDPSLRLGGPPRHDAAGPGDGERDEPAAVELARAVETRDPRHAASAGARLIGRGGGLTPEGDDLIAGAAAVVAIGSWPNRDAWLRALVGDELRRRTTALSATLLELAVAGMGPEPLQAWLAGDGSARGRLEAIGHSTGRAIAAGAALALSNV
jgi:Protein of unknown function (DUF2877)